MTTMTGTTITVTRIIMTPIMMVAIATAIRAITSPVTRFQEITSIGPSIQLGLSIGKTGSQAEQQDRFRAARDPDPTQTPCRTGVRNGQHNLLP
jgi:hypothetical protein